MQKKRLNAFPGIDPQGDWRPLTLCLCFHGGRLRAERSGGTLAEKQTTVPELSAQLAQPLAPSSSRCVQGVGSQGAAPTGRFGLPPPLPVYLAQTTLGRNPSLGATCRELCAGGLLLLAQGAHSWLRPSKCLTELK